jgi:hypothetical protein
MHGEGTPKITTQQEAAARLIEWQLEQPGGVPTQPALADTIETEAGWAFFNANGYLGTVTPDGDVIAEDQFADDEDDQ